MARKAPETQFEDREEMLGRFYNFQIVDLRRAKRTAYEKVWFIKKLLKTLGVSETYVDAFCGRVPKSVLARHYTDYSPEKLLEIYSESSPKVLS